MDLDILVNSIVERISSPDCRLVVLTGAGISAESGISTFRDPDGLWSKYRAEDLASPEGFSKNPQLVLQWYAERRKAVNSAQPNPGHYALAELEQLLPECTIVTQNVDGLHSKAGTKRLLELHGSIMKDKCFRCERPYEKQYDLSEIANQYCECGGRIRPAVVWFGESLPEQTMENAEMTTEECNVCWLIGTTGAVWPAAGLAFVAKRNGAQVVEFNPNPTELSHLCDIVLREKSGIALPRIVAELKNRAHID